MIEVPVYHNTFVSVSFWSFRCRNNPSCLLTFNVTKQNDCRGVFPGSQFDFVTNVICFGMVFGFLDDCTH
jgi:hypothetical protein